MKYLTGSSYAEGTIQASQSPTPFLMDASTLISPKGAFPSLSNRQAGTTVCTLEIPSACDSFSAVKGLLGFPTAQVAIDVFCLCLGLGSVFCCYALVVGFCLRG